PDGDLSGQRVELLLVEDLRHEPHVPHDRESPSVRDSYPGRLLAAMLEREEPEVGEARDVTLLGADSEDPAHLVSSLPGLAELRHLHSEEGSATRGSDTPEYDSRLARETGEALDVLARASENRPATHFAEALDRGVREIESRPDT